MGGIAEDDRDPVIADPVASYLDGDYRPLVVALWTTTGSREAAEDLAQEALARALDYLRRGRRVDDFAAFVRTTAINLSRNRWRSLSRERRAVARLADHPDRAGDIGVEVAMDLHRAILRLPRREREAVALVYQLDLPLRDAAERMGVAEGTVKALLSRARQHLADASDDEKEVQR